MSSSTPKLAEWRDLEKYLRKLGYRIVAGRCHKRILNGSGKYVGSLPSTCSDTGHGLRNKVGELRARGVIPYADGAYRGAPKVRIPA